MLHIYTFGGLRLKTQDEPLPAIASHAGRSLLAYLVTHADQPHTRSLLAGLYWPDVPEARARRRLSHTLWQIGQALEPLGGAEAYLLTDAETVQFNPQADYWLDVAEFARHQAQCTQGGLEAIEHCRAAVEVYQGDFLAGYYKDWVLVERERLRDDFLETLDRLIALGKAQGHYEQALDYASRLARHDPLREEAHREVMRLAFLLGRLHEAVQQYERCRELLAEELDAEPSPATEALHREIQDRLDQETERRRPAFVARSVPLLKGAGAMPFVGRRAERAALVRDLEEVLAGRGGVVLVEGEPGVGKTRLLRQMAEDAGWRGFQVLWGRGREGGELAPYGVLRQALRESLSPLRAAQLAELVEGGWLGEVSRLVPQLTEWLPDLPPPAPTDTEPEARRLPEAVGRVVLALEQIAPCLIVLDDTHWADVGTLALLAHLAPRLGDRRLLVVVGYRGAEARARPQVWATLRELDRLAGRGRLVLTGLDAEETAELVRRGLGLVHDAPLFARRLYESSGGNPLFLLETLRALQDEGLLTRDEAGTWHTPFDQTTADYAELPLSAELQRLIANRLARLTPPTRPVLDAAAVLGGGFDVGLLRETSGLDGATVVRAVEHLVERGLLAEREVAYEFGHDQIRRVAYDRLPPDEQQALHRRAAEALEKADPDRVDALAHHFTQGRAWAQAAHYNLQAARRAEAVHATEVARDYVERALHILDRHQPFGVQERAEFRYDLLLMHQRLLWLAGELEQRAADLEEAEGLARTLDDAERLAAVLNQQAALLCHQDEYKAASQRAADALEVAREHGLLPQAALALRYVGQALTLLDHYAGAEAALSEALDLLEKVDSSRFSRERAEVHTRLAQVYRKRGHLDRAVIQSQAALEIAERLDDPYLRMNARNDLGNITYSRGQHERSIEHYRAGRAAARAIGFRQQEAVLSSNLAFVFWSDGDLGQAIAHTQAGLDLYRELGDRRNTGIALDNLGCLLRDTGCYSEAHAALEEGLEIAAEIESPYMEVVLRCDLARLYLEQSDTKAAEPHLRRAGPLAEAVTAPYVEGFFHFASGSLARQREQVAEAAFHFEQAMTAFEQGGEADWMAAARSHLAACRLALGAGEAAVALSTEAFDHLTAGEASEEPLAVCWHHWRIMDDAGREDEAHAALGWGYEAVRVRQASLPDAEWQRAYVETVPDVRRIVAAWETLHPPRLRVRLAHAEAPLGRPLRDDEHVAVAWTVDVPEDEEIRGKVARRRHRLRRLLREAEDQGAAPTVDDLAAALSVSSSTIKRDLAALRAEGHAVPTRGSRAPGKEDR